MTILGDPLQLTSPPNEVRLLMLANVENLCPSQLTEDWEKNWEDPR